MYQVNAQQRGQGVWRPAALAESLKVDGFDQVKQRQPGNHLFHLTEELLAHGVLFVLI